MGESFRIDIFLNMNEQEKRVYLNTFNTKELSLIFESISLIHITLLDEKHLSLLLKNINIKKRILDLASSFLVGETTFNRLLEKMTSKAFIMFIDEETFKLIITSPKKEVILKAIVECRNQEILNALPQTILMEYLIKEFNKLHNVFDNISKESASFFFDCMKKSYPDYIDMIINLSSKNQWYVINHIGITNFYYLIKDSNLFFYLDDDVITMLIDQEPFYSYFLELDLKIISSLLTRGVILPEKFSRSRIFTDKIANILDSNEYRFLLDRINSISYNNLKRHKWRHLKSRLSYLDENGLPIESEILKRLDEVNGILPIKYFEEVFDDWVIEQKRERYYDCKVKSITDSLLSEYYLLYQNYINSKSNEKFFEGRIVESYVHEPNIYQIYYDLTTTKFLEILIDRYYKDITYNFLINLKSVVDFFNSTQIEEIDIDKNQLTNLKERLRRYRIILEFYDLTRQEQIDFYYSFDKNKDYVSEFYEDFNLAKTIAYNQYNEVVFDLNRDTQLINTNLSNELGVTVYELKGEPFYIYSHITSLKRNEALQNFTIWESRIKDFLENPFIDEIKTSGISLSFNGSSKIEMFRTVQDYVAYGFCHLNPNRIAHVYHSDSYSAYYNRGFGMDKINEIYTPQDLLDKTCKYNEILYQEINDILFDEQIRQKYEVLKPDYLLCYDDIGFWDINLAKRLEIPILVIYTKYYPYEKENYDHYRHTNEYITTLSELRGIKTYLKK